MANQITLTLSCENAYYTTLLLYLMQENKVAISDEALQYVIDYISDNETDLSDLDISGLTLRQLANLLMQLDNEKDMEEQANEQNASNQ